MSLVPAASPESIVVLDPVHPASAAENARYGLQEGSGDAELARFAFGLGGHVGMRTIALRRLL